MFIREMHREDCLRVLARTRLARLACSHENQPYVVPVYLGYEDADQCLYGFTTPGQKIEWMRDNPRVCVEVDEIAAIDRWVSVVAMGRFEELPDAQRYDGGIPRIPEPPHPASIFAPVRHDPTADERLNEDRNRAWRVLQAHPEWWEPGCSVWTSRANRDTAERYASVFYKISIDEITGHEAISDTATAIVDTANFPRVPREGWFRRTLSALFTGN